MIPLVSIGCPVYNGANHIGSLFECLLGQTYGNIEIIISDNQSTDGTLDICEAYAQQDARIRIFRSSRNKGVLWNLENSFALSSGKYFMWACVGDEWRKEFVSVCVRALIDDETLVLSGCAVHLVSESGATIMAVDPGVQTVGIEPVARVKRYLEHVDGPVNINGIFCGIYRSDVLGALLPLKRVLGQDHILLALANLYGGVTCSKTVLMNKRWGGLSKNISSQLAAIFPDRTIVRTLHRTLPYVCRDYYLRKTLFSQSRLSSDAKRQLSFFLYRHYFTIRFRKSRKYLEKLWARLWYRLLVAFAKT